MKKKKNLETLKRGSIKLSEAILRGAKKRKQSTGRLFKFEFLQKDSSDQELCSCALGAAIEGLCKGNLFDYCTVQEIEDNQDIFYKALDRLFPEINFAIDNYLPAKTLYGLIINLNDYSKFTREEIAEKVKELGY